DALDGESAILRRHGQPESREIRVQRSGVQNWPAECKKQRVFIERLAGAARKLEGDDARVDARQTLGIPSDIAHDLPCVSHVVDGLRGPDAVDALPQLQDR